MKYFWGVFFRMLPLALEAYIRLPLDSVAFIAAHTIKRTPVRAQEKSCQITTMQYSGEIQGEYIMCV